MHFALPPRKTSRPPPYHGARQAKSSTFNPRRSRLRVRSPAIPVLTLVAGILLLVYFFSGSSESGEYIPSGTPSTVIVTTIDHSYGPNYERMIKENRRIYAARHNYETFFPNITDYDLRTPPSPLTWSKVPAMRHAMTLHPHSTYFFFLDQNALIMRPDLSIEEHIMSKSRLEALMIPDKPVVPPDSVIHTLQAKHGERVELVLTQDPEGLSQHSFILKRGSWARFFLDSWFDPLYRSYNFQRAEGHALEHLVQWHGTVLAHLALIPQKIMNSYTHGQGDTKYTDGDFVAHLHGCDQPDAARSCEQEAIPLFQHFESISR